MAARAQVIENTARPRLVIVGVIGVTQILAWGSTFHLLAVLATAIVRDTGWTYDRVMGGLSLALLSAGMSSPRVGRAISIYGGRRVLAIGAILSAGGLLGVALAPNLPCYLAAWVIVGVGMGASLHDAAFSTLGVIYGSNARSAITAVTLFGGFSSTLCWPASAFLTETVGWRGACVTYAAIQLCVVLPLHLLGLPRHANSAATHRSRAVVQLRPGETLPFALTATSATISASILSLVVTQLITIIQARGFSFSAAVALGMLLGPCAVGARTIEALAGHRYHPIWTMVASVTLVAMGGLMLWSNLGSVAFAIIVFSAGNGIGPIARGTVPLAFFGPERYPVLMGRLAFPLLLAMAISPFVSALAFRHGGVDRMLQILVILALCNIVVVAALLLVTKAGRAMIPPSVVAMAASEQNAT